MQRDRKSLVWALAALLMVGSLAGGLVIAQSGRTASPSSQTTATTSNFAAPALGPMVPAAGFSPIVKMAGPSVVSITSTSLRKASDDSDPFSQFFGGIPGFNFRNAPQQMP